MNLFHKLVVHNNGVSIQAKDSSNNETKKVLKYDQFQIKPQR